MSDLLSCQERAAKAQSATARIASLPDDLVCWSNVECDPDGTLRIGLETERCVTAAELRSIADAMEGQQ